MSLRSPIPRAASGHSGDGSPPTSASSYKPAANSTQSRKVNRSCLECTRRKVKCDGRQPCSSCIYYRSPDSCGYRQRSVRNAVSRSTFKKASEQLEAQGRILQALFPGIPLQELATKSQADLFNLVRVTSRRGSNPSGAAPSILFSQAGVTSHNDNAIIDDSAPVSENGDAPDDRKWDESLDQTTAAVAADDINGMGHATGQPGHSYLGMTSMSAIFRTIFRLCPAAKEHTAQCCKAWTLTQPQALPSMNAFGRDPALNHLKEQRCIDFYFEHVHSITPLLDEEDFRMQYAAGTRTDASWLGLLNMVFAVGSIASGSDSLHEQYYRQARQHLDLDCLGAGNLESLQALCILGGYYLHYRNSPNMAYGVHGAAHRVAVALGFHREPRRHPTFTDPAEEKKYLRRLETQRRTWWSLFCLDVWATMPQGRPTAVRWDDATMDTHLPTPQSEDDHAAASLRASAKFCLMCDRIQDRCAQFSRLSAREVLTFDAEILAWWEDEVPTILKDRSSSAPGLVVAREFVRSRFNNIRVILSRSSLLYLASDRRRRPEELGLEQQQIMDTCCQVAAEAIDAIALYWTPNRLHVWNSGWYLFQACMVPLLSIAIERSSPHAHQQMPAGQHVSGHYQDHPSQTFFQQQQQQPRKLSMHSPTSGKSIALANLGSGSVAQWKASLAKALETFAEMRPWMRASDRSPEIVSALYEALTSETDHEGLMTTPAGTEGSGDPFGWSDEGMMDMNWSAFLGDGDQTQGWFPFS